MKNDWCIRDGERIVRLTLRHKVRVLIGIHGQMHNGEYLFPKSWKYPRWNRMLNKLVNLIPAI